LALRTCCAAASCPTCADVGAMGRRLHARNDGYDGMWFTPLLLLAFLVLLALGAYYILKEFAKPDRSVPGHGERALEILKERYARGEITSEEYLKMKEELES
jgi:putative membrane protein